MAHEEAEDEKLERPVIDELEYFRLTETGPKYGGVWVPKLGSSTAQMSHNEIVQALAEFVICSGWLDLRSLCCSAAPVSQGWNTLTKHPYSLGTIIDFNSFGQRVTDSLLNDWVENQRFRSNRKYKLLDLMSCRVEESTICDVVEQCGQIEVVKMGSNMVHMFSLLSSHCDILFIFPFTFPYNHDMIHICAKQDQLQSMKKEMLRDLVLEFWGIPSEILDRNLKAIWVFFVDVFAERRPKNDLWLTLANGGEIHGYCGDWWLMFTYKSKGLKSPHLYIRYF